MWDAIEASTFEQAEKITALRTKMESVEQTETVRA